METGGGFSGGEETGDVGHLRVAVDADAAHHVVGGGADFHRLFGDVEVGELLELVVHAGELALDVLLGLGDVLLDPGDVEEDAAVRRAAAGFDFAVDAAGDVVAGEEFGRAARVLVALRVAPAFFFVVGGLLFVEVGDVVEHEAAAFAVAQHAAFAAHAFGDENAAHADGPDHAGGMELDELHVLEFGSDTVGKGEAVAGVFPAVAGDFEGAADAAGGEDYGFRLPELEAAFFAVVSAGSGDAA